MSEKRNLNALQQDDGCIGPMPDDSTAQKKAKGARLFIELVRLARIPGEIMSSLVFATRTRTHFPVTRKSEPCTTRFISFSS